MNECATEARADNRRPDGAGDSTSDVSVAVSTVIFALDDRSEPPTGIITAGAAVSEISRASLRLPLVRRIRSPYEGQWALPGGPLSSESALAAAASATLRDITGLEPTYLEQLFAFGDIGRSPGSRVVSIVYWALVRSDEAERASIDDNTRWFPADALPELAFDHNEIVAYALWRLRTKMEYARIAHAFLGETFTLAQLREVYEAVLGKRLDPANFRRQVEASGSLIATDRQLEGGRHRTPPLYSYNESVVLADNGPLVHS